MVGRTLLHYRITAPLGSGGFGRVFLALDLRTERQVALKFLDDPVASGDRPVEIEREARAASRLNHPGIVTLYGLEVCDGQWFLVEEYVEGENLHQRLTRGPLPSAEIPRLGRQLMAALAHAHGRGVLHRDIKPANILITAGGDYKLADFGLAHLDDATRSDSADFKGTIPYAAPERLRGRRGDERADLYSAGAVLYEAMSGQPAFPGNGAEAIYSVLHEVPTRLVARSPSLEPWPDIIDSLLAKDPVDRPASARGLIESLEGRSRPTEPRRRPNALVRLAPYLLAVAGLLLIVVFRMMTRGADGPVAVIEFRNVADSRDSTRLGLIASNLLTTDLAVSVGVGVLSTECVLEAAQGLGTRSRGAADRVAQRTRASWMVTGTILRTEPNLLMTAELFDVASGRIMHAVRVEGLRGQTVFEITDLIAQKLAPKLARVARPESLRGPAPRSTKDVAAYQRYVEGIEYESRGELAKAEIAYGHALKRDPDFGLARERLAAVAWRRTVPYERETP